MTASVFVSGTPSLVNNANATAALGGTTLANDVAVAWAPACTATTGHTIGTPSGYTPDKSDTSAGVMTYEFHKVAGAGESNPVMVPSGFVANDICGAAGAILRGIDTTNVVHVSGSSATPAANSSTTPIVTPALTVTNPGCLIIMFVLWGGPGSAFGNYNPNADGNWTTLSAFTVLTTASVSLAVQAYYRIQTTAANISASTITLTGGGNFLGRSHIIAYNAAAAPLPPQPIVPGAKQTFVTETIIQF